MYKIYLTYDLTDGEILSKTILDEQYSEEIELNDTLDIKAYNKLILKSRVGSTVSYDNFPFNKVKKLRVYTFDQRYDFPIDRLLILEWTVEHFKWNVYKKVIDNDNIQHSNFLVKDGQVIENSEFKNVVSSFLIPEDKDSILIKV